MPSLKELLETAFKLTYTQALPTTPTTQSATVDGSWHTVVSPSDGYIVARIQNATNCRTVQIETNTVPGVWTCNDEITSSFWGTYIPVRKGQVTRTLVRYDAPGMSQILFVPTVGAT